MVPKFSAVELRSILQKRLCWAIPRGIERTREVDFRGAHHPQIPRCRGLGKSTRITSFALHGRQHRKIVSTIFSTASMLVCQLMVSQSRARLRPSGETLSSLHIKSRLSRHEYGTVYEPMELVHATCSDSWTREISGRHMNVLRR